MELYQTVTSASLLAAMLLTSACSTKLENLVSRAPPVEYSALGQDPGWALRIDATRMALTDASARTRLSVATPVPVAMAAGRRYAASRIVVDIVSRACNDAISGQGFEDTVIVSAGGRTLRGCGGSRLVEDDN